MTAEHAHHWRQSSSISLPLLLVLLFVSFLNLCPPAFPSFPLDIGHSPSVQTRAAFFSPIVQTCPALLFLIAPFGRVTNHTFHITETFSPQEGIYMSRPQEGISVSRLNLDSGHSTPSHSPTKLISSLTSYRLSPVSYTYLQSHAT
mgnify:CR=1 FL=1